MFASPKNGNEKKNSSNYDGLPWISVFSSKAWNCPCRDNKNCYIYCSRNSSWSYYAPRFLEVLFIAARQIIVDELPACPYKGSNKFCFCFFSNIFERPSWHPTNLHAELVGAVYVLTAFLRLLIALSSSFCLPYPCWTRTIYNRLVKKIVQ